MSKVLIVDDGPHIRSSLRRPLVRYVRSKLEASGEPRLLHTVRGVGSVLRAQ